MKTWCEAIVELRCVQYGRRVRAQFDRATARRRERRVKVLLLLTTLAELERIVEAHRFGEQRRAVAQSHVDVHRREPHVDIRRPAERQHKLPALAERGERRRRRRPAVQRRPTGDARFQNCDGRCAVDEQRRERRRAHRDRHVVRRAAASQHDRRYRRVVQQQCEVTNDDRCLLKHAVRLRCNVLELVHRRRADVDGQTDDVGVRDRQRSIQRLDPQRQIDLGRTEQAHKHLPRDIRTFFDIKILKKSARY
jgi:hypothetical protein